MVFLSYIYIYRCRLQWLIIRCSITAQLYSNKTKIYDYTAWAVYTARAPKMIFVRNIVLLDPMTEKNTPKSWWTRTIRRIRANTPKIVYLRTKKKKNRKTTRFWFTKHDGGDKNITYRYFTRDFPTFRQKLGCTWTIRL